VALRRAANEGHRSPHDAQEAARGGGYAGLRLEAISRESGLAHSLIRYHFGSKDGLVGVLIDWLLFETYMTMHRGMTSLPLEDASGRLRTMTAGLRRLFRDPLSYRLYLEVVVAALHDEGLRPILAESFVGQRRLILEALETSANGTSPNRADALSAIVVAFSDGLAMQYVADPANVDLDTIFEVWDEMMKQAALGPAPPDASGGESEEDSEARDSQPIVP
jgi:AcrR family transcriptional regulator